MTVQCLSNPLQHRHSELADFISGFFPFILQFPNLLVLAQYDLQQLTGGKLATTPISNLMSLYPNGGIIKFPKVDQD